MLKDDSNPHVMKTLYIVMTDVLDEAVEAQARGSMGEAAVLSEQASVLGKAAGILANRAELGECASV